MVCDVAHVRSVGIETLVLTAMANKWHRSHVTDAKADITVVVPTALHSARADSIERAVESILSQSGVRAIPLLVVNGPAYDRDLLRRWQSDPRVRCHYLQTGSLPGAIRHGRSLVETPYFSFLDDDDLYEPNTLQVRVSAPVQ